MPAGIKGRKLKYVITGTPRSGTGYMAKLFTSAGVPIGHEMFFGQPGHGYYPKGAVGDSSWMAVPFIHNFMGEGVQIIHVVRDPLKVVSSMHQGKHLDNQVMETNEYSMFKRKRLPSMMRFHGLDRYLYFWTAWNKEISNLCQARFKLEEVVKDPTDILKTLGIRYKDKELYVKKYNQRENPKYFKLEDLHRCNRDIKKKFLTLAESYGYTYP
jgi:hypothetical protein